jgi:hypothetical protein
MDSLNFFRLSALPNYAVEHFFRVYDYDIARILRDLKKSFSEEKLTTLVNLIIRRKDTVLLLINNLYPLERRD